MWSPADTVETVAAVAEVLVAAGTGFLAWKTHGLAAETKKMAAETSRVAEAAEQQANAAEALVKETQQDRELAWSPFLIRSDRPTTNNLTGTPGSPPGYSETVRLTNVGSGQALDCLYVARLETDVSRWCYWRGAGLAGGESTDVVEAGPGKTYPLQVFDWSPGDTGPAFHAVLLCRDVFGNYLRFPVGRDYRDRWREGDMPVPTWVNSVRAWGVSRGSS